VLHDVQRGVQRVVACSAEAANRDVATGMPLAEVAACGFAKKTEKQDVGMQGSEFRVQGSAASIGVVAKPQAASINSQTATLVSLPYDPWADREALEALATCCGQFSPTVVVEPSTAPESLLLDITGLAHLFGGETSLAERILDEFTRHKLVVRIAIADTLGAAWAVAHFPPSFSPHSSLVIRHSSFTLVPPGETSTALHPLPIESLRLPEDTVELLHQLGIIRVGQLAALPREELSSRFPPQLLRRMDQASGRVAEPVPVHVPPPEFQADWSPEQPTARSETIEAALEHLIAELTKELVRLGRGAMRLECRLDCRSQRSDRLAPVEVSVGLFQPTASAAHLFQLARMQLERVRLPGPVSAVQVRVAATAPRQWRQQELFSDDASTRRHPRPLASLIDRLSSRLGRRAVLGVRLTSDAQPELAWRYEPLVESGGRRRLSGRRRKQPADLPPRPLRLLPRPVSLVATSVMPEGPPLRFHLYGREHRVAHTWGPERIETGWWRGRVVGRDYYRIETASGQRLWLFRRLRDGRWFMHGMFE